jgi:murein DD-endopeptidase MepM/ murein hydrolase activator NlpD
MAITTLPSSLISSANKIVAINSKSKPSLVRAQIEYKRFGNFIETKSKEIERISLPDNKKIQKLANINVVNTFGSAGGLLKGLLGGGLDLGGLVKGFFPGENTKVGASSKIGAPKVKPTLKGGKLRLGGLRALGVANSLFAGLDFATGLTEGESVGKSAAGTSGSLAGSLLGGAIGQTLIPIPGLGFVIGSAAGSFLGGYGADRAYDTVASQRELKARQEAKLKEQSQSLKKGGKVENQDNILDKFEGIVDKFEGFVSGIVGGIFGSLISGVDTKDMPNEWGELPEVENDNNADGSLLNIEATGGDLPSSRLITSGFGPRRSPRGVGSTRHMGVDYDVKNEKISIIQPGIVKFAGLDSGKNGAVYIDHPDGSQTRYLHLSKINVKEGQAIEPGTVIGTSGGGRGQWGAGQTTGPHLHFEYAPPGSGSVNSAPYADKFFRIGGNVKVKQKSGGQTAPTSTGSENSNIPNNKSRLQSDVEGFRQFRNQNFGASKSRVATAGPQNFQIREMGVPGNKGYQINPLADYTNYEIHEHKGAGHLENRAFDIPVPNFASGDKVNQYWTSRGYKTLWRVKDHFDHVHVEIPKGKVQEFTKINSKSQVTTPPPKRQDISYNQSPYLQNQKTLIVNNPSTIIAAGGGGEGSSKPTMIPVQSGGGGGGGTVVVVASNLNSILDYKLATA